MVSGTRYGCSSRKTRGTCDNSLTIKRTELVETILSGLKDRLMDPELVKEFIWSYHDTLNNHLAAVNSRREDLQKQLAKINKELEVLFVAVKAGIRSVTHQAELEHLEHSKQVITLELATEPPPPIQLHPNLAEAYRQKLENLTEVPNTEESRQEAADIIHGPIDEIHLVPDGEELHVHLTGELAEMLTLSTNQKPDLRQRW